MNPLLQQLSEILEKNRVKVEELKKSELVQQPKIYPTLALLYAMARYDESYRILEEIQKQMSKPVMRGMKSLIPHE